MSEQLLDPADLEQIQAITAKDRSNLYLTSQFLSDPVRYQAFLAMYAVMRVIDDAVDDVEDKQALEATELAALHRMLDDWQRRIDAAYAGQPGEGALDRGLAWALARFPIPAAHWRRFIDAMHFDVDNPRFADFEAFLDYTQGASVAPTTIYVFLLCAEAGDDGVFRVADFDVETCGRELGVFAYLAHVLRDVRRDALVGRRGLVYLSLADLAAVGLSDADLRRFAETGTGDPRFAALVQTVVARARVHASAGEQLVDAVAPGMAPDRAFVLRLIVAYYGLLLERIAAPEVDLFADPELLPGADKLSTALQVAQQVGFELPQDALARVASAARGG